MNRSEIEKKLLESIGGEFTDVKIIQEKPDMILFEITHMYRYDWYNDEDKEAFSDENLCRVASEFGFKHYDVYYDISEGGCETCDYGSRYGKAIRFWK